MDEPVHKKCKITGGSLCSLCSLCSLSVRDAFSIDLSYLGFGARKIILTTSMYNWAMAHRDETRRRSHAIPFSVRVTIAYHAASE